MLAPPTAILTHDPGLNGNSKDTLIETSACVQNAWTRAKETGGVLSSSANVVYVREIIHSFETVFLHDIDWLVFNANISIISTISWRVTCQVPLFSCKIIWSILMSPGLDFSKHSIKSKPKSEFYSFKVGRSVQKLSLRFYFSRKHSLIIL